MDTLQYTGLAATVVAVEDIDPRGRRQRHRVQVTHSGDGQADKGHRASRLQTHRHDDVRGLVIAGFLNQRTAIGIGKGDAYLVRRHDA